jgi:carbon monoxide dehydrogenase subunit G
VIEVIASAIVPAPQQRVWEAICDTSRYAEWVEGTDEVTRTDGPARLGCSYDEVNPVLGPWQARSSWEVTEFEPPRRQVHRGTGLPLTREFHVIFELASEGDSTGFTLTLRAEPSLGPVGGTFAALMRGQIARDNRRSAENLAALVAREVTP